MPLHPGTTLGPYAVTAKIGEGDMGECIAPLFPGTRPVAPSESPRATSMFLAGPGRPRPSEGRPW